MIKLTFQNLCLPFLSLFNNSSNHNTNICFSFSSCLWKKLMNYSWPSVRNFNLSINQALAQGRLTWGQMDVIQARSNTFFSHADLRSSQNTGSKFSGPRQQRDPPRRERKDMYCTDWNYTAKCSCNITDPEYKNTHHCRVCDSDQHPMLHCGKRRYPIPTNKSAQQRP